MPASVFCNMIMFCFSVVVVVGGGMEWSGESWGYQTQSALREGLLDLIQHIPKQRRLITFSVNGHGLSRLGEKRVEGDNIKTGAAFGCDYLY